MKKTWSIIAALFFIGVPSLSYALGIEAAIGKWKQEPSGYISYATTYNPLTSVDLENDLRYDEEWDLIGRVKIDLPVLPTIYLMATPQEYDGTGNKAFTFGGYTYIGSYYSEARLTHYDAAIYYGIPLLKTATLKKANLDIGANIRYIDFKAAVTDITTTATTSKEETYLVPMVFAALQLRPVEDLSFEVEGRGIIYKENTVYSVIGRAKLGLGPLFVAGGYRQDVIQLDEREIEDDADAGPDIKTDMKFKGPFIEVGFDL